jgi:hypothetical protein
MTDRELFEITLDALEEINKLSVGENAICLPAEIDTAMDALRERLAQPEDWQYVQKLNAFSYPRPWVGLDDDEYQTILGQLGDGGLLAFYILIESKLKEKNGGSQI